ncbi:bifunctional phosphoribosylaminoimidazolecarboxamide formyltransferase/IMP cyclohydrolase [Leptospira sp. GIMC2001]|uniref:bifunctional phosphoribosylaminoimidazolecarboxamide formyltransferase/IMP cyclohydrolase n=1 Tax=Leptospira sp. GIMC2001 TaxID=1513297 RepID=UPI00234BC3B3|nr:bifunctional phosphoribosylaminoimidazolecarboxamide formyltransferase/IMP cyclohydrolase [Leptospira sp. GIMC2001]WCL50935.1 bifunctional phosphoribosylaminoimidazolecarboxamide formyltransferase/IMP cyclohydrolase [Leptospira sp. GIMC2001]
MIQVQRALISVSDKTGVVEFAKFLVSTGVEILSTGGTLDALQKAGIKALGVDDYTGFPEILGGRLKTLHPLIHGGLLGDRSNPQHVKEMEANSIKPIQLVIVNLYPFVETVKNPDVKLADAIEKIDIGGPTMLRSAAKNYKNTAVVLDPSDYSFVQKELEDNDMKISEDTALMLSAKVFSYTAYYDTAISTYLNDKRGNKFPDIISFAFTKKQKLRYGENPHQEAAYYEPIFSKSDFAPLQGKELSFNNMLDLDAAFHIASLLPKNAVSIVKHLNPCGIAYGKTVHESFTLARKTDPISAFGGIIGVHGTVDKDTATAITENFVEGIVAEGFSDEALEIFSKKPNIRLIPISKFQEALGEMDLRPIHHGMLVQNRDYDLVQKSDLKVVSKLKPTDEDMEGLWFAWQCVKFIKSNAIVYTDTNFTLGIGAGQMSRVDSVELGASKAQKVGLSVVGSYVGSDAFFPFRDGIDAIAKVGAKAIIQPGGSIRDEEVIAAADEHGIIMVFTGMRHFRH